MAGWLSPDRLARLRRRQELAFAPIFIHRPLSILLVLPIAEVRWITPNLLTSLSVVVRLVAAALLCPEAVSGLADSDAKLWTAVILWHFGHVLDGADGTLARYRKQSSLFGRYYDKVSDRVITLAIVSALAARVYIETGRALFVFFGMFYVAFMSAISVSKWIEVSLAPRLGRPETADPDEQAPPRRDFVGWLKYLAASLRFVFVITEMDLPLWGTVALFAGRLDLLFWALGVIGIPYGLGMLVHRGLRVRRLEREARPS